MIQVRKQNINYVEPPVIVSIASHGDAKKIKDLIESIEQYERRELLEIIVVDNIGDDDFADNKFRNTLVLRNNMPKGFAYNQNLAFKYARDAYFCVLNPDIIFIEPVFERLISIVGSKQADIVSPLVIDSQGIVQDSFRDLPTPGEILRRRLLKKTPIQEPIETLSPDWLAGMFLFMRTDTFQKLGGFDERYHLYFEDVDFCTRARLEGFRLALAPNLRIRHDAHRASEKRIRYLIWHLQSAVRFFCSQPYKDAKKNKEA